MNENIKEIQERIMNNLERLDNAKENINEEVSRSNAIAELSNTYIKSCNLSLRLEEARRNAFKSNIRELLSEQKELQARDYLLK